MSNSYDEITMDPTRKGSGHQEKSINVGHGNYVVRSRIVSVCSSNSSPVKRAREVALENHLLIDATKGKKTKSVIFLDSKHLVLSSLTPQTLHDRFENGPKLPTLSEIEMGEGEFLS